MQTEIYLIYIRVHYRFMVTIKYLFQVKFLITQLIISTHLNVSAAINGLLQELNCLSEILLE